MIYRILKVALADQLSNELTVSIFDEESQEALKSLNGPAVAKINIKTLKKVVEGENVISHIGYKIIF